jgi:hypothetical protein
MPRAQWALRNDRPVIEIVLTRMPGGQEVTRTLLADTGAGNAQAPFEILLEESDCVLCRGSLLKSAPLLGAFTGSHPIYLIPVKIPLLGVNQNVPAIGVPTLAATFDGIACFRFLNRFTYGNFGNRGEFALET